jgi:hypothetical protein
MINFGLHEKNLKQLSHRERWRWALDVIILALDTCYYSRVKGRYTGDTDTEL